MKFLKRFVTLLFLTIIFGCATSERVIMDGKVYTIKGKKIFQNDIDISKTLTSEEKKAIQILSWAGLSL